MRHVLIPFALAALAGCEQPAEPQATETADPAAAMAEAPPVVADPVSWVGTWKGPEGTSLVIEPAGEAFTVKITDLDRTRIHAGKPSADGIVIERGREPLTIRAGSGDDTGMKWLAGKTDCLIVGLNEGYCRD